MFLTPVEALTISSSDANLGGDGGTAPKAPKGPLAAAEAEWPLPDPMRWRFPPPTMVTAEERAGDAMGDAVKPEGTPLFFRGVVTGVVASESTAVSGESSAEGLALSLERVSSSLPLIFT